MNRLSKAQLAERDEIVTALNDAREKLDNAITEANDKIAEACAPIDTARDEYNAAVERANAWIEGIRTEQESYYDEKSEKWQEGERGEAYSAWKDEFEIELDEVDEIDKPEIDAFDPSVSADDLSNLPEEPQS